MKTALVFPGQGSQSVGMGSLFYDNFKLAKSLFQQADDVLQQNLTKIILTDPGKELMLTANAQPAIMLVSFVILKILEEEYGFSPGRAIVLGGHSLGEYTAATVGGSIDFADTLKLLRLRGKAMQEAVPVGQGTMAAIIGLDVVQVAAIVAEVNNEASICQIANDNCPGQVVISGHVNAVEQAMRALKDAGAKRTIKLSVSVPFHCSLMQPAQERAADYMQGISIKDSMVPIYSNVTARAEKKGKAIAQSLIKQITNPVQWRTIIENMIQLEQVSDIIEVGNGNVLTGLNKRISDAVNACNVDNLVNLKEVVGKYV